MEDITHTESIKLTKVVTTKPTTTAELIAIHNQLNLKHVILGAMVWDSLTATYQLDLIGNDDVFKVGDKFNGVKLWYFIKTSVNPSTAIGVSTLKDLIEEKKLSDFECHNVK